MGSGWTGLERILRRCLDEICPWCVANNGLKIKREREGIRKRGKKEMDGKKRSGERNDIRNSGNCRE